jgi:23S rRNA (cytidine1920-2'-O)/16S rRNA (cytidine1409-2'-O)-methyltransferase
VKERLDKLMVERGLAASRERAKALIMGGKVLVNGVPVSKAGTMIPLNAPITLKEKDIPYVSRGGLKLEAALKGFSIDFEGKTALDVGASTGGFTDCMLKHGASKVYAVDVGYGQFDMKLREDPRVVLFEKTNVRNLEREKIDDDIDIATVDVSFISLKTVMPYIMEFLKPRGEIVALIKPQFEVGKADVGKGGVVRDDNKRLEAVSSVEEKMKSLGLAVVGLMECPVKGPKGNIEHLIYLRRQ